jgi:two-component system CAI-1 autoinducer sensor kinase/phosphatase CqsS
MSTNPSKSNHYVLFIDDEEKTVKNFKKLFETEFNIIATTNHEEIFNEINKSASQIAVIISDQRMPKISGVDLLKKIKEKNPNIIRVLTTAYADLQDNIRAINDSNVFAYISKPWDLDEVRNVILRCLKEYESHQYYLSLSGSIAHEMRNPLNSIRQSTKFAKERLALASQRIKEGEEKVTLLSEKDFLEIVDSLDIADFSAKRGDVIIDIILNSISQKPISVENFRSISVLEMTEIFMREYAFREAEKQRVVIDIGPNDNFTFTADEALVSYIFFNLIKNSLYYVKTHPNLKIKISAKVGESSNQIFFIDNGPGIKADKLDNIFNAFFTSGKVGGTGLGLVFCKRAMKSFGGDISCNSKENEFCEFILSFPKKLSVNAKKAPENHFHEEEIRELLKDKQILIADDENINLFLTAKVFEKYQVKVDKASNGNQALKMAGSKDYDVILMDIGMPEMDGLTATKQIRNLQKNGKRVPIIAVTGDNSEEKLKAIIDAGFDNYFVKGREYVDLIKIIATALLV